MRQQSCWQILPGGSIERQTYKCFWVSQASPQKNNSLESSITSPLPWLLTDSLTMSGVMSTLTGLLRKEWKWWQRSLHQIPRWWDLFPLGSWWPSLLQLPSWNTGHLHRCRVPIREWETNGKYRHLHRLPVNPTSSQLSWSRPDDPGPALLPCQPDSSTFSISPVGACSCGTDRNEIADILAKIGSKAPQTQNLVPYKEAKTLLHSRFNGDWEKENGGYQAHLDPIWRLERAQQTTISACAQGTVVWMAIWNGLAF